MQWMFIEGFILKMILINSYFFTKYLEFSLQVGHLLSNSWKKGGVGAKDISIERL